MGYHPKFMFFLWKVSKPGLVFFLWKVSNPGHGTKIARGLVRYKDIGYCSIKSMSLLKPGTTGCHGTRIARGVPLPVYINLDLYSGFWCTSRCVVFKYSVPPLTDQVLWKVLLNQLERS